MEILQSIVLDFARDTVPITVFAKQYDQKTRFVLALDDTDELALGVFLLKMKSPQNPLHRHGLIVLHEDHIQPVFRHIPLIVGLHKVAAAVPVDGGFDDVKPFDGALGNFDLSHSVTP